MHVQRDTLFFADVFGSFAIRVLKYISLIQLRFSMASMLENGRSRIRTIN